MRILEKLLAKVLKPLDGYKTVIGVGLLSVLWMIDHFEVAPTVFTEDTMAWAWTFVKGWSGMAIIHKVVKVSSK